MNVTSRPRRSPLITGVALAALIPLAACSSGPAESGEPGGGADPESFSVLIPNENPTLQAQLTALSEDQCSAENDALPLDIQTVAQSDVVQRVTLLAGQGALPAHFVAGTAMVRPDGDLGSAGLVLDYEEALTELGVWDDVLPAAASTITNVYGHMVSMPYQYNIEGIWYNTQIFDELGLEEPQTFDELLDVSATLLDAGYTPFAAAGADMWPVTRLIGMYIFRNVGPDAMADIQSGDASLTDPEYVEAAAAVQELAQAGFLGEGFVSKDAAAATNDFLTGKAAMKYDGSWLLSNINDPEQATIGAENIALMPFPAVSGGAGSIDQWAANAGTAFATNPETFGPGVGDWLSCIAENYGSQALGDAGVISGFRVNDEVPDLPEPTRMVQERVASIDDTVLWFEALMDGESTSLAQSNMSLLVTGQMTPEDYMAQLQSSIDSNR